MKLKNSLLNQYLLIILFAIMIVPISFLGISILFFNYLPTDVEPSKYQNGTDLEAMWHEEAQSLAGASDDQINEKLTEIKKEYSEASMFWVDETGQTRERLPESLSVPPSWSPALTIDYMKKNRGLEVDPFTVVALIGKKKDEGFMILQVPRSAMLSAGQSLQERYSYAIILAVVAVLAIFIFISWIFFYKIRKRLLRLQQAMSSPAESGIPDTISVEKRDEIGQLEVSFNEMIHQLEISRVREKEEEMLRRQLIANLSHDLRTPLTTIRGHAFSLKKEALSGKGKESLDLIDNKIGYLGQLIENLLSYTLLTTGKYPYYPERTDMVRLVKTSFAAWYPVFEGAGFQMEVEFPETTFYWEVDPQRVERVLDNFYQNIYRHARNGAYIGVKIDAHLQEIFIEDHGPGMGGESIEKGAGIGLSIVSLMLKDMKLKWETETGEHGTMIKIRKRS
ncbi:HAMP domain-containing histidine kinase [Cytobacillus solani]|uniref:HAMP domain-containing sensor histidine kinase n=1 Tax=Cytobacillus solani TaxID=1637975 RepID=UPI00207A98E5|nr:HAMP domain-containing sensor histidine kinase [Cytobacillus solani]USK54883.1 HAMP domain-containing histidine kinase [Cytobacillus solani]